jgi:hypothetical protein
LAGNLETPLMSLYGTEWRERGYGLRGTKIEMTGRWRTKERKKKQSRAVAMYINKSVQFSVNKHVHKYRKIHIKIIHREGGKCIGRIRAGQR